MTTDPDRIAVPTNGRGPHAVPDAGPTTASAGAPTTGGSAGAPTDEEMSTALSPRQLAVGFGIVASLLLLFLGWARHRRRDDD